MNVTRTKRASTKSKFVGLVDCVHAETEPDVGVAYGVAHPPPALLVHSTLHRTALLFSPSR
jgi:hypothetical protein